MNKELHTQCAALLLSCWVESKDWNQSAHEAMNSILLDMRAKFAAEHGDTANPYCDSPAAFAYRVFRDEIHKVLGIVKAIVAANYADSEHRQAMFYQIGRARQAVGRALNRR
jgi:hypothetical protein